MSSMGLFPQEVTEIMVRRYNNDDRTTLRAAVGRKHEKTNRVAVSSMLTNYRLQTNNNTILMQLRPRIYVD